MRDYIKQQDGEFSPEVVDLLIAGFEDTWAIMRAANGVTRENIKDKRDELGRMMIALVMQGERNRESLCKAALAHFGLLPPTMTN